MTQPAEAHADEHAHDDDLIVTPKGTNRTRFLLTLILILFVLVMFVVADLFQYVVGGRSRGGANPTYLTWRDPVSGEEEAVDAMEFQLTQRMLGQLGALGLYRGESGIYGDRKTSRSRNVEEEDVASFLVYEDLAEDAGLAISDREQLDVLRAFFTTGDNIKAVARDYQMTVRQLEDSVRRIRRVERLKSLLQTGVRLPDPDTMLSGWQDQHVQHAFEYVALSKDAYTEAAMAETPTDEELLEWWHGRPAFEQQQLYSEEKTVPQVAWLALDGSYDATALLEAYPRPEGVDEEQLAQTYYDRNRAMRFRNPTPPESPEGTDDAQADAVLYRPFEEVREDALREAKIEAALADFLRDLDERVAAGEEGFDLAVEVTKYGLESFTSPDPMTRADMTNAPGWGNANVASRLGFSPVGKMLASVVVEGDRMYIGRVLERTPRAEQPLAAIRPQVLKKWQADRAQSLALERAQELVAKMAEKPAEHNEDEPWTPVVDADTFRRVVEEAGLTVTSREWAERGQNPGGPSVTPTEADRFINGEMPEAFELPEGAVGAPKKSAAGQSVYLVRHVGEREKPLDEIKVSDLESLPNMARFRALQTLGEKAFWGGSDWFTSTFQVRYPDRERREAEAAKKSS